MSFWTTSEKINNLLSKITKDKEDLIIKDRDIIYQITSTENQKNKTYFNISSIQLGEYENKLKAFSGINQNDSLFIFKIDYFIPEFLIPIVEYEVYNPITKTPLNLNICEENSINITIPVFIDENNIFKYDDNNSFYNDKCYPYTTINGTDITLNDRKKEYNNNNLAVCENNCNYVEYENETKKVTCECKVKNLFEQLTNININKNKLLNNFIEFSKITNIEIIKCYKRFLSIEGIKYNSGSYILIFIIFFNFISMLIFYSKDLKEIHKNIKNIIKLNIIKNNKNKKSINNSNNKNAINNNKSKINIIKKKSNDKKCKKNKKKEKHNPPLRNIRFKNNKKIYYNNSNNSIFNLNSKNLSKTILKNPTIKSNNKKLQKLKISFINYYNNFNISKNTKKKLSINNNLTNFTDNELNKLKYKDALIFDKRTYFEYYISLLKTKQLFIFTFYTSNDYNSRFIKICLFFFSFSLLYTVNCLFFQDDTIHKIYEDYGKYNFEYQIPQILYSTIISTIITALVKFLSLSEKNIIEIKNYERDIHSNEKIKKVIKVLNIKFITFFTLHFILLIFFWYYLGCFGAVYRNTQLHLLKDTIISFAVSLLYPFIIHLFPGIFRIPALRAINKNKNCLYIMSLIIQFI